MSWSPHDHGQISLLSHGGQWLGRGVETVVGAIARAIEALAFWTAVGLPFVYLPMIVGGVAGQQWLAIAGLLLANVISLIAGHDYARDQTT